VEVTFFFDPVCEWSWRASRWLAWVSDARGLDLRWRSFSLTILNDGTPPEHTPAEMAASSEAQRIVEALWAKGRHEDAGRFYAAIGARTHDGDAALTGALVWEAAHTAGVTDAVDGDDTELWDEAIRRSHEAALDAAGPGVGSPVFAVDGEARGLHGPILAELPSPTDALTIWDSVLPLLRTPVFFEIKRGRR
jgi:hypothetical protein